MKKMKNNILLLLLLFIVQAIKYGESLDERTPSKLNYSLLFKKYLFRNENSTTGISRLNLTQKYQIDLLKNRNKECLLKKFPTLNDSKFQFTSINQTFADLWRNNLESENLTDLVDHYLDNTVRVEIV